MNQIREFHAPIYYDEKTFEQARLLCEATHEKFGVSVGHMHRKPVGPHPCWSCQLTLSREDFGEVILWLALNRNGLVVFIHPDTGNDVKDHSEHALWMGEIKEINLSFLKEHSGK
ncbi:MAG TPA: 4,5-dioxygenase [Nitrospiria bacterium]|nr:4,5-dioxygenase [Candidatus Manganitrophaceae bacterium]HIL35300.1 4,5-dioxygenase [Candidatus Manganitrophaceae bacterium]